MKSNYDNTRSSTTDKIEGESKIVSGSVKENVGKLVRSPNLEAKGNDEKLEGRVQKKVGEIKKVFGQ